MRSKSKLPIYEQFHSWQGEGVHQGRSAYFIRSFGCPVHCPWCDSAGTWHPDYVPKKIQKISPEDLVKNALETKPEFIVITGGEPCIHNLNELCERASKAKIPIHLETSGAFQINGCFDWITLSPKVWKYPLKENIIKSNEIKIIVDTPISIRNWIEKFPEIKNSKHIWLHPEWSKKIDSSILNTITEWVKNNGNPYRAGYQVHKLFSADLNDPQSLPDVPLGGNENLGI
tara:strand:+ start:170 stop:859 length:690 start_codon:yes stop_codon:yes gene_type:complete